MATIKPKMGKGRPRLPDHLLSDDAKRMRLIYDQRRREGYKTTSPTVAKLRRVYLAYGEVKRTFGVFAYERGSYRHNGKLCHGFTL